MELRHKIAESYRAKNDTRNLNISGSTKSCAPMPRPNRAQQRAQQIPGRHRQPGIDRTAASLYKKAKLTVPLKTSLKQKRKS